MESDKMAKLEKEYRSFSLANKYCVFETQWIIVFDGIMVLLVVAEISFLIIMIKKLKQKRRLMLEYNEYSNNNMEV